MRAGDVERDRAQDRVVVHEDGTRASSHEATKATADGVVCEQFAAISVHIGSKAPLTQGSIRTQMAVLLVPRERLELPTCGLGNRCSVLLSYRGTSGS